MRSTWILWLTLALALGCVTGVPDQTADDDSAGDDDAGDDDAGDDDAGDDDGGDDDAGDDDGGDDDTEPDLSHLSGEYHFFLDFGEGAESQGYGDCEAPYEMAGDEVTGEAQALCEVCDRIYQVNHKPDPPELVQECISQVGYDSESYERLYGLELVTDSEFYLWRNFGDVGNELEPYGWGELDGAEFWFESDPSENWWVTTWADGGGVFGE